MDPIGKFHNSSRPGERQAFQQRPYMLPAVRKRTVVSIARANNEKIKGYSPTELAHEARTRRNPKAELRALEGRPLGESSGENSGESMNKETYKEYVRQRLHEEYYNKAEKKEMRKSATAKLATDASERMTKEYFYFFYLTHPLRYELTYPKKQVIYILFLNYSLLFFNFLISK